MLSWTNWFVYSRKKWNKQERLRENQMWVNFFLLQKSKDSEQYMNNYLWNMDNIVQTIQKLELMMEDFLNILNKKAFLNQGVPIASRWPFQIASVFWQLMCRLSIPKLTVGIRLYLVQWCIFWQKNDYFSVCGRTIKDVVKFWN